MEITWLVARVPPQATLGCEVKLGEMALLLLEGSFYKGEKAIRGRVEENSYHRADDHHRNHRAYGQSSAINGVDNPNGEVDHSEKA